MVPADVRKYPGGDFLSVSETPNIPAEMRLSFARLEPLAPTVVRAGPGETPVCGAGLASGFKGCPQHRP